MWTEREDEARDRGFDPHPDDNAPPPPGTSVSDFVVNVRRMQGRCYQCGTPLTGGLCPECIQTMEEL